MIISSFLFFSPFIVSKKDITTPERFSFFLSFVLSPLPSLPFFSFSFLSLLFLSFPSYYLLSHDFPFPFFPFSLFPFSLSLSLFKCEFSSPAYIFENTNRMHLELGDIYLIFGYWYIYTYGGYNRNCNTWLI